ncbi:MAG: hypothetical protein WCP97_03675 [bacterium]
MKKYRDNPFSSPFSESRFREQQPRSLNSVNRSQQQQKLFDRISYFSTQFISAIAYPAYQTQHLLAQTDQGNLWERFSGYAPWVGAAAASLLVLGYYFAQHRKIDKNQLFTDIGEQALVHNGAVTAARSDRARLLIQISAQETAYKEYMLLLDNYTNHDQKQRIIGYFHGESNRDSISLLTLYVGQSNELYEERKNDPTYRGIDDRVLLAQARYQTLAKILRCLSPERPE